MWATTDPTIKTKEPNHCTNFNCTIRTFSRSRWLPSRISVSIAKYWPNISYARSVNDRVKYLLDKTAPTSSDMSVAIERPISWFFSWSPGGPSSMNMNRVGTGTSVMSPNSVAFCRRMNAYRGLVRQSTSPTRMLEASAPAGIFLRKCWLYWQTHGRAVLMTIWIRRLIFRESPRVRWPNFHTKIFLLSLFLSKSLKWNIFLHAISSITRNFAVGEKSGTIATAKLLFYFILFYFIVSYHYGFYDNVMYKTTYLLTKK